MTEYTNIIEEITQITGVFVMFIGGVIYRCAMYIVAGLAIITAGVIISHFIGCTQNKKNGGE